MIRKTKKCAKSRSHYQRVSWSPLNKYRLTRRVQESLEDRSHSFMMRLGKGRVTIDHVGTLEFGPKCEEQHPRIGVLHRINAEQCRPNEGMQFQRECKEMHLRASLDTVPRILDRGQHAFPIQGTDWVV